LTAVKGVVEVKPSVDEKLVRVKFDPKQTSVKALVNQINTKTEYRASEPKATTKPKAPAKPKSGKA
jgi:copper chaperone CopZ